MGFWSNVVSNIRSSFRSDRMTVSKVIDLLGRGVAPVYLGKDLFNIPEVRTAINFVAEKVGGVPFHHIRADTEGKNDIVHNRVELILNTRVNPKQSPQVFWTEVISRLLVSNNSYIMPEWDYNGNLKWLHPLPFINGELIRDSEGDLKITFNGQYSFYYDDIIHLQRFPNQGKGRIQQATGNYVDIVNTMQAQAVNDSESSGRIAALLQVKSNLKSDHMKKKLEEFKELFLTSENSTGFGMIGAEYDVHKLDLKIQPLDTKLLTEITSSLYNYFGVSMEIINNTATELQYEQFVDNTLKPIVRQIEQELSYKIFSMSELYHGNKIQGEMIDLEISTLTAKTTFFKEMVYGQIMNRNEIRKRLRMPKGPAELDKFQVNKNFQTLEPGNYVVEKGGNEDDEGAEITTATET